MPQNFFHIYVPLCLIKYALPQVLPIAHAALNLSFLYLTLAINSYSCHLHVILLVPEKFDPKRSSQRRSWAWTSEKKQRSKFLGSASLRVQYGPISLSHIKEVVDSRFPDASLMFLSACSPTFHPLTWSWVPNAHHHDLNMLASLRVKSPWVASWKSWSSIPQQPTYKYFANHIVFNFKNNLILALTGFYKMSEFPTHLVPSPTAGLTSIFWGRQIWIVCTKCLDEIHGYNRNIEQVEIHLKDMLTYSLA